jgi:hypothetical protein
VTKWPTSPVTRPGAHGIGVRWALVVVGLFAGRPLAAQVDVSGYALGVASRTGSSTLLEEGSTLLGRGRLMAVTSVEQLDFDVAYEHVVTYRSSPTQFSITTPVASGSGDWLGTDWTVASSDRTQWRHRLDRLSVAYSAGPVAITVGRQSISWATTLFLTPADPFAPFDPTDPFRVYRGGVDAVRLQFFPGPFTEVEAVVRASETTFGATTTAVARAQTSVHGWSLGSWAGAVHDEAAAAVFATGAIGATAVRAEAAVRDDPDGGSTLRAVLGLDRLFTPAGKDLYLVAEVQYDGFGARSASNIPEVILSKPFIRGEMQVIGEWSAANQISYQIHPIVGLDALALTNLDDGSTLVAPGVSWSATGAISVRAGVFVGLGAESELAGAIESEYGAISAIGYASLTWYF